MSDLTKALAIAIQAHAGQTDKAGLPYILHPLRVMLQMDTDVERIVAVLHDVIEDSDQTIFTLHDAGFSLEVVAAIDVLTRHAAETYEEFILRVKQSALATKVKLADLHDNLRQNGTNNEARDAKYRNAIAILS